MRHARVMTGVLLLAASAEAGSPILHEPLVPDPREDLAFSATLPGGLHAALDPVGKGNPAPEVTRPPAPTYPANAAQDARYRADRDTRRPNVDGYEDPFTPSTAPFKRLEVFDTVRDNFELGVHDPNTRRIPTGKAGDETFLADLRVDALPRRKTRIPSVAPSASIVRSRLTQGDREVAHELVHDGADNWFLLSDDTLTGARLVMELSVLRATLASDFASVSWGALASPVNLPDNVRTSAAKVHSAIGLGRSESPRDNVNRMVRYFRAFSDSEESPRGQGDIYLDLALSRKGVCRHRAFAFLITSLALGIPTRMVMNEAHAWVEVSDGQLWHRIDLGGAGRMTRPASDALPERPVYQARADTFPWPSGSERGDDMVARARAMQGGPSAGSTGGASTSASSGGAPAQGASSAATPQGGFDPSDAGDLASRGETTREEGGLSPPRISSTISLSFLPDKAERGETFAARGSVRASGEPCAFVSVQFFLRDEKTRREVFLGTAATDSSGDFSSSVVVGNEIPVGDFELVTRTQGDTRCGPSAGAF